MTSNSSSDDFFNNMGASPPPAVRPATRLTRPPPSFPGSSGTSGTSATGTGTATTFKMAPPAAATATARANIMGPPPGGSTATTREEGSSRPPGPAPAAAGRTPTGTASAGRNPSGATQRVAAANAGRGTATTAAAGRTGQRGAAGGTTGRGSAAGRSRTAAGRRPVGGTGFSNPSTTTTHLSNPTGTATSATTMNPYASAPVATAAGGASSDSWFNTPVEPAPQQQPQPAAMNPYASATARTSNPYAAASPVVTSPYGQNAMMNQWQQPQPMQSQQGINNTGDLNPWQQPVQAQQPQQQLPGSNFFTGTIMSNDANSNPDSTSNYYNDLNDFANEPPLLEELGINIEHIMSKTKAVILPFQRVQGNVIHLDPSVIVEDADLAGPLFFALALGGELLMTGKLHFGYIYGFGLFGCLSMTLILNLMTPKDAISVWTVASILGYALLPVNVLAAVKIVVVNIIRLETLGRVLALVAIIWSTVAATRLLEVGCGLRHQRYLIAYPLALLYSAFVLMTMF